MERKNYQNAGNAYERAIAIPQSKVRSYWLTELLVKFGKAKKLAKDENSASEALERALRLSKSIDYKYGQALALEALGEINSDSDDYLARRYFFQAATIFDELGQKSEAHKVRELIEKFKT